MKPQKTKSHKKKDSSWLFFVIAILFIIALFALFLPRLPLVGFAEKLSAESEVNLALDLSPVYCAKIPLYDTEFKLSLFNNIGDLKSAVDDSDLTSTLPLPMACLFDCGLRLLPARDGADFMELMSLTNFGETLNEYSCNLPFVEIQNLKGELVRIN